MKDFMGSEPMVMDNEVSCSIDVTTGVKSVKIRVKVQNVLRVPFTH